MPPGLPLAVTVAALAVRGRRVRVPPEEPVLPPGRAFALSRCFASLWLASLGAGGWEGSSTRSSSSPTSIRSSSSPTVGLELLSGLGLKPPGVDVAGAVELELGLLELLLLSLELELELANGLLELLLPSLELELDSPEVVGAGELLPSGVDVAGALELELGLLELLLRPFHC